MEFTLKNSKTINKGRVVEEEIPEWIIALSTFRVFG